MGTIGNALHMSFHVRGFELERYEWYMELRSLHYVHHLGNMATNFAMLNMGMDGLFHSLALRDPLKHKSAVATLVERGKDEDVPQHEKALMLAAMRRHAGINAAALALDVPLDMKLRNSP